MDSYPSMPSSGEGQGRVWLLRWWSSMTWTIWVPHFQTQPYCAMGSLILYLPPLTSDCISCFWLMIHNLYTISINIPFISPLIHIPFTITWHLPFIFHSPSIVQNPFISNWVIWIWVTIYQFDSMHFTTCITINIPFFINHDPHSTHHSYWICHWFILNIPFMIHHTWGCQFHEQVGYISP